MFLSTATWTGVVRSVVTRERDAPRVGPMNQYKCNFDGP